MPTDLTVVIHDESDPVLAIVTGDHRVIPVIYRDYRGMYVRPASQLTRQDFAEWVVIEHFDGATIVRSKPADLDDMIDKFDQEYYAVVHVVIES